MKSKAVMILRNCLTAILLLAFGLSAAAIPADMGAYAASDTAASITLKLPAGPYTISKDKDGLAFIQMENFSQSSITGDPMLPHRAFNILVPPDILWDSLSLRVASTETELLEDTYDIKPAPPIIHTYDSNILPEMGQCENYALVNGRDMDVYGTDADFPTAYLNLLPYSQMRKWDFARVDFTPFQYNPVTKKLTYIKSVTIELSYQRSGVQASPELLADTAMDSLAPQLFFNFNQSSALYPATGVIRPQAPTYNYVIITTSAIQAGSTKLASFVAHKQSKGYSVLVATEAQWGAVTGQAPNTKADKIRKWLQDNYISYGIQYVLLIGNPTPYESGEGDVPMKMCWPLRGAGSYEETPTDHYYSDLTGNWDINGNLYYGESPADTGSGGVDLSPEVYVGRIPVYDADYTTLDSILQKTIDYENESSISWRKGALLPMSFSDSSTDGAYLAEQMKTNYLDSAGYSSWRMYQQGSDCAAANSIFISEEELRSGTGVRDRWVSDDYGIVSWWGHGNSTGAYSGYGECGSGAFMTSSYSTMLDDDHPAFTYQCSCTNGYPEASYNLQYSILKQGGIGTVGATRVSWYYGGQTSFVNSPSNSGIGYEYIRRLVANDSAGLALYSTMQTLIPIDANVFLMNCFDFNLYGDPTVKITSNTTPFAPTVNNASGATDVTATMATLNGNLTSDGGTATTVHIYWGGNDGGTGTWGHDENLGVRAAGAFSTGITGLTAGTTYYYRCSATNSAGTSWAESSSSFITQASTGINLTVKNREGLPASDAYVDVYTNLSNSPIWSGGFDASGQSFLDVPDGTYIMVISSWNGHFYIVKTDITAPCSLVVDASAETVPVAVTASKLDGNPLAGARLWVGISAYWPRGIASADGSGQMTVYLTPFTYRDIFLWDWGNLYYLYHSRPTIPGAPSALAFASASMPTGQCLVDVAGFTQAVFIPFLRAPDATATAPCFTVSKDNAVTFSAGGYDIDGQLTKSDGAEDVTFLLELGELNVTNGSTATLHTGGNFSAGVLPERVAYNPGDWVNLNCLIADGFNNRLSYSYIISSAAAEAAQKKADPIIRRGAGEDRLSALKALSDVQDIAENYPTLTLRNPDGTVFQEIQTSQLFYNYGFQLPPDARNGIWTATLSFDTGSHQGVIQGTTPINVNNKAITSFNFNALSPAVIGVITEATHTIALTVPSGINITALVPTITHTGASISPASGSAQNFTNPVTYTVTAADSSTQAYAVSVNSLPVNKLIGSNDAIATGSQAGNLLALDKWVAGSSGTVTQVRVKAGAGSNIKVAIYADNAGEPGALLNANNSGTAVGPGIWDIVSIPSTPVIAGTAYWLGFVSSGACTGYVASSGTTMRYKTGITYSGFSFPNPAGAGFTSYTSAYHLLAGWGTPPPVPPATTFITPGAALTFKWGAVDRANKYHLQVNTLPGFNGTDLFNAEVGNITTMEVIGLSPGTTYYWRVKAGNAAGWSGWSATRSITASTAP